MKALTIGTIILGMAGPMANGQSATVDHVTQSQLMEKAQRLRSTAVQSGGSASETLQKYPNHFTMLAFRDKDGEAELHPEFADIFYIVDGHATLTTGGTIVDRRSQASGEIRGSSVKNGTLQELGKGDIVHIPANVAHQILVPRGSSLTYFVVKVQEQP